MTEKTEKLFLMREEAECALSHLKSALTCISENFSNISDDLLWIIESLESEIYAISTDINCVCNGGVSDTFND